MHIKTHFWMWAFSIHSRHATGTNRWRQCTSNIKEWSEEYTTNVFERLSRYLHTLGPHCHRGMGPSASIFSQKLEAMIAAKRGHTYQRVITWIRQRLTFSLLRSAISAIRATRFLPPPPPDPAMMSILTSGGSGQHWQNLKDNTMFLLISLWQLGNVLPLAWI